MPFENRPYWLCLDSNKLPMPQLVKGLDSLVIPPRRIYVSPEVIGRLAVSQVKLSSEHIQAKISNLRQRLLSTCVRSRFLAVFNPNAVRDLNDGSEGFHGSPQ